MLAYGGTVDTESANQGIDILDINIWLVGVGSEVIGTNDNNIFGPGRLQVVRPLLGANHKLMSQWYTMISVHIAF
jgi:hypothetical protein